MLADLFSQFDPSVSVLFKYSSLLFWGFNFLPLFIIGFSSIYAMNSGFSVFLRFRFKLLMKMLHEMGVSSVQGLSNFLLAVFIMILIINLFGLFPGTFSVSSHFIFSMSMGIPLWLCLLLMSFSKVPISKFGSYIGTGIPVFLGPPIGVCEVISAVMRPLALGLRLAANMLAGHVITSLVANCSSFSVSSLSFSFFIFGSVSFGLFLFEGAVCVIQSYVFMLLLGVYIQEYPVN